MFLPRLNIASSSSLSTGRIFFIASACFGALTKSSALALSFAELEYPHSTRCSRTESSITQSP